MNEADWLAARFEENRNHLRAVAYRMLGSANEADDAVQEAWFRLSRAYSSDIGNLTGWLTTTVGRVCLDMLRSRRSRREDPTRPRDARRGAGRLRQRADRRPRAAGVARRLGGARVAGGARDP